MSVVAHSGVAHSGALVAIVLDWERGKVWLSATSGLTHHDFHCCSACC
ncbi:hypothetical protein C8J47_3657 [Sphingomonas sp. PP-F2F-G114-C0414]|nr:hypothetical protein [Sphingomonas sp. PP-F2F-G114-C0414]RMB25709.1 hypothetical protein C8J47_3657 [Sphingomonas sp. PP-F2F-G114-C0414]